MNDMTAGTGWTCPACGRWVNTGEVHDCPAKIEGIVFQPDPLTLSVDYSEPLAEVIELLKEISEKLDKLDKLMGKPWKYRPK